VKSASEFHTKKIASSIRHFGGRNFAGGRQEATPTPIMPSVVELITTWN